MLPRRQQMVYWRRRAMVVVVVAAIVGILIAVFGGGGHGSRHLTGGSSQPLAGGRPADAAPAAAQTPALEAGLMPWALPSPLSRMAVFPAAGPNLTIAGGLTPADSSTASVATLNTTSGAVSPAATLSAPVHDAAAAVVAGRDVIFGGGSASTFATVQAVPAPGSPPGAPFSRLPRSRSDATAVSIGATTYIVGGFDGSAPTGEVLSTLDGRTFTQVATLAVPVRYPAVAAAGDAIYVFGGEPVTGGGQSESATGPATDVIQRVDPGTHRSAVVAHLPVPLAGAAAFTLQGHLYVAGGKSPQAPPPTTGVGTTQLNGWATAPSSASSGENPISAVWAFDPGNGKVDNAGQLQIPVSNAGVAVTGGKAWLVGGESGNQELATVQVLSPNASFGLAGHPGAGSPYYGSQLLVADRGNNRLLLMNPAMQVTWTYPNAHSPPDPLGFYFPDDAFFVNHGTAIMSNQEENETIVEIGFPSGAITWSYGHPKQAGTAPGYLHEPDDAYLLRNGQITVADAQNCRVLVINRAGTVASRIGTDGSCVHRPPASMGSPNGDTPLWDGNLLVSEINGSWVSEYTPSGKLVWTTQLPLSYPSDPQQLGAGPTNNANRYLIADYATPGEVLQFTREGQVLSTYRVTSGPGALDHPSLAEELPNGIYMINDDYNNRMVAIDPTDGALVWQYGVTKQAGSSTGMLNTPDGFDLLGPNGTTPTHPQTG